MSSNSLKKILFIAFLQPKKVDIFDDCTTKTRRNFILNPRNPISKYTRARNPKETCTRITKTQRVKRPKASHSLARIIYSYKG